MGSFINILNNKNTWKALQPNKFFISANGTLVIKKK